MKTQSQGRWLIGQLKRKPHTYLDMLDYAISTSPWRRVVECLRDTEKLEKGEVRYGDQRLVTWRVVRAR
jgi:hypothetical protein